MPNIPEAEQLEALISGGTFELAKRYAGGDHRRLISMLTVTLADVVAHARRHQLPRGWFHFEAGAADGVYLIERSGRWCVYRQERGQLDGEEAWFDTEPVAFEYLIATHVMPG